MQDETEMKVLHFGRFYNDNFGGIERHVAKLLKGLGERIHVDNLVANESYSRKILKEESFHIYKAPSLGIYASTAICPTMPLMARDLHKKTHYDIVHLHFPDPMSHLATLALPSEIKLVITWHSDIVRQKNLLKLYQPFLDRLIARADGIIAATPAHFTSSTQLSACKDDNRKYVVPYGLDFSPYENKEAERRGRELRRKYNDKPIIFALGRHVEYKGFEYLIRAMKQLSDNAILLLGGSGPLTEGLKQLASSLNLTDRVFFQGRISEEDLPSYFHACDLFCLPSITPNEAFGLVQVEAMICRKPIICCELGNGVNYVNRHDETGLCVPPANPHVLAEAITNLLENDALRIKMGNTAYLRTKEEFNLSDMINKTLNVYQRILSRARPGR